MSDAFIVAVKPYGESQAVVQVFAEEAGLLRGLVRGARRQAAVLQPGVHVQATHRRRLSTQLGTLSLDVHDNLTARLLHKPEALMVLRYVCDVLANVLPEEHPYPAFYQATQQFCGKLAQPDLWQRLAFWELQLLMTLGYGLSLRQEEAVPCQSGTPLSYVSPKSGRAVSAAMGEPYRQKLLPLSELFGGPLSDDVDNKHDSFALTGYFLRSVLDERLNTARQSLLANMNCAT